MKEAISNAFVFNLVIVFVIILLAFFIGSIGYSKASKVKNRIVEEIEKEAEHSSDPENAYTKAKAEIENWLAFGSEDGSGIGYRMNTKGGNRTNCPSASEVQSGLPSGTKVTNVTETNDYEYCVYRIEKCDRDNARCDLYYRVIAYMYFDVPVIGQFIQIPIVGETMSFTTLKS